MKNELETIFDNPPGNTGAILTDAGGNVIFEMNPHLRAPSASTIKTLIMAETARQIQLGRLNANMQISIPEKDKLEDSILGLLDGESYSLNDLVTMMIIISDNTATNIIIDLVGMDNVNALAENLGMHETALQRKMLDWEAVKQGRQNYTSPADLALLFRLIVQNKLPMCEWMMWKLEHQKHSAKFTAYLPENVRTAHKPGSIPQLEADSGVIYLGDNPFIWCVSVSNAPNRDGEEFISRATGACYRFLTSLTSRLPAENKKTDTKR